MKMMKVFIISFLLYAAHATAEDTLVTDIVSGTTDTASQTDLIEQILKGANSERDNIMKMNVYQNFQAYRDGANFGVIYEYTVVDGKPVQINAGVKGNLVTNMRSWFTSPEMKKALDSGFYIKFTYKKSDGTVLHDFVINKADF